MVQCKGFQLTSKWLQVRVSYDRIFMGWRAFIIVLFLNKLGSCRLDQFEGTPQLVQHPSKCFCVFPPSSFYRSLDLFYVISMITMNLHSYLDFNNPPHVNGYGFLNFNSKYKKTTRAIYELIMH